MAYSRLQILKPYGHLVGNIDHVVLDGKIDDVREGDIVLDGMFWVRSISRGTHNNGSARTVQLAPLESPGINIGRLVLSDGVDVVFARPVEYETWDPQTTNDVDIDFNEATATLTSDLRPGDFVGWIDGDPYDDNAKTRARRVVKVWVNGLIQFEDGAYQSTPSHSWYCLDVDTRSDVQACLRVANELVDPAAHAYVVDRRECGTDADAPFVQWRDVEVGDKVRFETAEVPLAAEWIKSHSEADYHGEPWEKFCDEHFETPFFHDRTVAGFDPGFGPEEDGVLVRFEDEFGPHQTRLGLYMTVVSSNDDGEK